MPTITLSLTLAALAAASPAAQTAARPPNIVFILADDLGHGALGCYGQQKIATPNIDRIAVEGMRFTRFYAGSNVCAPSRSVLMTGLHTGHTPVRANGKNRYLYAEDVTLAEVLKKAGYATGGFGKWGLGTEATPGMPMRQGFDDWFGYYHQVHAHFYYPYWLWRNDAKVMLPENEGRRRARYSHDEIQREALAFIRASSKRPFFAYLPYTIPHVELVVPEDSEAPYRGKFPKVPIADNRPGYLGSEDGYATYAGMVSRLDRSVGEVLALVRELGLERTTIVLFSSDNGAQGGARWQPLVEFFDGTGGLRGSKGNWYEGGIRVPLVARWPGRIRAGTVTDHVSAFCDVLPTLADLAGAPIPAGLDGLSFAPTLLGRGDQKRHEYLYWEMPSPRGGITQAVRMGDWKAVRPRPDAPLELYDLRRDPKETTDLAGKRADVLKRIEDYLKTARTEERDYRAEERPPGIGDYVR